MKLLKKNGKMTYLVSNVELNNKEFITLDEGIEVGTNKKIWGSEKGPLKFRKVGNLDKQLVGEWLKLTC